ncbi:MAG TPA: flagellar motor switch protein FliG [Roseiarcus sp.]|jgi:flagellar motor switch protein FliG
MSVTSTVRIPGAARRLKGSDKVAALLLAMGKPVAGRLLKHFDPLELRQITKSASGLGAVPTPVLEALVEEFSAQFSNGLDLLGNAGEAEQLLTGAFPPEQVADILSDVLGSSNSGMWEKLAGIPENVFAAYLLKEHPQTAAFVLSKLSPSLAAKISAQLPRDFRNEAMRRMLSLEPVQDSTLRSIEGVLQEDLLNAAARHSGASPHSRMANIINQLEPEAMEDVLQSLALARPKEVEILKKLLFSFDDMLKLSVKARATLFDKIPTERVVLALRGTQAEFRDGVLSSLTSRARRLVESELDDGSVVSPRDVAKARRMIADLVLEMAQRNEIEIASSELDAA